MPRFAVMALCPQAGDPPSPPGSRRGYGAQSRTPPRPAEPSKTALSKADLDHDRGGDESSAELAKTCLIQLCRGQDGPVERSLLVLDTIDAFRDRFRPLLVNELRPLSGPELLYACERQLVLEHAVQLGVQRVFDPVHAWVQHELIHN
jgi:hypothetical protein